MRSGRVMTTFDIPVKTLPKSSKVSDGPAKNVMVIEDDIDSANAITLELILAGYGVHKVSSREAALSVLDCYLYDFILLDYHMPGMSAGAFVDRVRERRPATKIVLMTAGTDINQHAAELGVFCCIPKPFDPVQVVQALQEFAGFP
jgi:CheY-like chemotaxis protein